MDPFFANVRDCDDDERLDKFSLDQAFRSFVDAPFHAGKRSCRIKYILSVVQIEHGITLHENRR